VAAAARWGILSLARSGPHDFCSLKLILSHANKFLGLFFPRSKVIKQIYLRLIERFGNNSLLSKGRFQKSDYG